MNIGAGEYLSFQFIGFFCIFLLMSGEIFNSIEIQLLGLFLFIFYSLFYYVNNQTFNDLLAGLRVGFVMVALYGASIFIKRNIGSICAYVKDEVVFYITSASVFAFGLFQLLDSIFLNSGFFDVPKEYFAIEYGTLFSEKREVLSNAGYFIRPSAFYSEPSAMAAFGLIVFYYGSKIRSSYFILVSYAIVLVSNSMSGLIALIIFTYIYEYSKIKNIFLKNFLKFMLPMCVFFAGPVFFSDRIAAIFSGEDVSAMVRIYEPLNIVISSFSGMNFLGMSRYSIDVFMSDQVSTVYDNWLFNQVLFYGIFFIFPVLIMYLIFGRRLFWFAFIFSMLNGEVFYYDRAVFLFILMYIDTLGEYMINIRSRNFY